MCLLQLYAYEYKCVTDLGSISLTGLLAPFAVHVHCHMIAYVTVINNVWCIEKDLRHQLLYYCWRLPRRSDDIRNMFFFISCDIEYSFSVTHVYLLFGVIYTMTCMYIYCNKAFWNWKNWKRLRRRHNIETHSLFHELDRCEGSPVAFTERVLCC